MRHLKFYVASTLAALAIAGGTAKELASNMMNGIEGAKVYSPKKELGAPCVLNKNQLTARNAMTARTLESTAEIGQAVEYAGFLSAGLSLLLLPGRRKNPYALNSAFTIGNDANIVLD